MTAGCWEILAIDETNDAHRIRAAWFDLLRQYRPRDDDATFNALRVALDDALLIAREWQGPPTAEKESVATDVAEETAPSLPFVLPVVTGHDEAINAVIAGIQYLYADFSLRQQPLLWRQLLASELLKPAAVWLEVSSWLVANLGQMPFLSVDVKAELSEYFEWDESEMLESDDWDPVQLEAHLQRMEDENDFTVPANALTFTQPLSVVQIDAYLAQREAALALASEPDSAPFNERIAALQAQPVKDPDLLCWLATHFRYAGNVEASRTFSKRLIDLAPDSPDGWLRQAQINMDERDYCRAWDDYCQVLAIVPRHILALKGLAQCLLGLAYLHDARSLYELIFQQAEFDMEAQTQLLHIDTLLHKERQIALKKSHYRIAECENLAESYNQTGAYTACIDFVLALREQADTNSSRLWRLFNSSIIGHLYRGLFVRHDGFTARDVSAPLYISLGYAYERTGQEEEAKKAYQWALNSARQLRRDTFPAREALLNVMAELEEWQLLIPLLEDALSDRPSHAYFWYLLAEAYRFTDRPDDALEAADRAIALDTRRWVYFSARSLILLGKGEFYRALADLDEVVRGADSYAWGWHRRGICLNRLGRHRQAMACFELAIGLNLKYVETALELVKAACECDEYNQAQRGAALYSELNGDPQKIAPWLSRMSRMAPKDKGSRG